ncbi:MAG: cobyrinate a,c-diamide synthase [Desulfobacter sp.]|nr:cobyrinate a,c-diamide synthase [Desulfobacter sp.]
MKGFVIGATGSGTGKTTISLALMAWLEKKGIRVAPFKVGPDFIDPGLHSKVAGSVSFNLDSWMLSRSYNRDLFYSKSRDREIAVVEGVMGLFDGYDVLSDTGSTAQMAKWLDLPVLLVVSAKGKARSAAAIVKGFEAFDPDLKFAGVVFAQAGSQRHYQYLKDAVEQNCTTPCLGYLPQNEKIVMPERHLGLVTADEMPISSKTLSALVSMVDDHLDMDRLINGLLDLEFPEIGRADTPRIKQDPSATRVRAGETRVPGLKAVQGPGRARIAVARDKAFCFYYPDNLEMLEAAGAELVYFSPLTASCLPEDIDGIYFGGGYPELNAKALATKTLLLDQIQEASLGGMPIYGECGGFMFLCRDLISARSEAPARMCRVFEFDIQMSTRLRSLGYREITLTRDTLIGKKGDRMRGHEFHYSSMVETQPCENVSDTVYEVASRVGQKVSLKGYQKNMTLGSYFHLHFGSSPGAAPRFVGCCEAFRKARSSKG